MPTPSAASFSRATSRSIASGTGCTPGARSRAARHEILDHERLQGEGHVHDRRRMALAGREVDDAPGGQQVQAPPAEVVLLDERQDVADVDRDRAQGVEVDLHVEVPGVGQDRAVLHALEVLAAQDRARAGDGDEDVAARRRLQRGHDLEALHPRLQRAHGIDLADHDLGAGAAGALGQAAPGPAVAEDDEGLPGQQDVGRAQDAVERRLAGAVVVVEDALGVRLVDGDDRARQAPLGLERADAQQARGRLLGAADQPLADPGASVVHEHHEVGAVVERDVRAPARARRHVGGVGLGVLAVARMDLRAEVLGQRRRRLVLRGERVGGAQRHLGAPGDERAHEVGGLGGDVQARRHRDALERALVGEALADRAQDGHLGVGPFDARPARGRERGVGDVRCADGHRRPPRLG